MASVEKYSTKSGPRYMVRFRDADRHQSTKRGFHSLRDARRFASSVETKVVSGDYIRPSAGKMTVGELTVEYLSGRSHLKPKSRESLRSLLDSRVLPRWRDVPITRSRRVPCRAG